MNRIISLTLVAVAVVSVASYAFWHFEREHSFRIFVSNYKDDTVSVVDGKLDREKEVIKVGDSPSGIDARRNDPMVAVANSTGSRVTLIDGNSLEIAGTIPTALGPEDVAFSKDGKLLFVTFPKEEQLSVFDVARKSPVGDPIPLSPKPLRLLLAPDGSHLYVLLAGKKAAVAVIDPTTRQVEATVPVGPSPTDLTISGDGRRLLTSSFDTDTVTVIDTEKLAPVAAYDVTTGEALLAHPRRSIAYSMASFDSEVHVFDFETGKIIKTMSFGEWPTHSVITDDGKFLYLVQEESQNLVKVDTDTNEEVLKISVGSQPTDAVILPGS